MSHHPFSPEHLALTRREFLSRCGMGMGALGLASMVGSIGGALPARAEGDFINPLAPHAPRPFR